MCTGDLDDDPQDQAYPCQIPPQGSPLFHRNSSEVRHVQALGVPIFGGSYGNSGSRGNVDIQPPPTEYHHPGYCDLYDTGGVSGDRTSYGTIGENVWDCGKTGRENGAMECSNIRVRRGTYDTVKLEKEKSHGRLEATLTLLGKMCIRH